MNEHALDAMIYAWQVMKEKEENKMDNVFMGKIVGSCSRISEEDGKRCASVYFHDTESNACDKLSHYNKTYSLVLSDDVIKTNDELLKMRDEVRRLTEVCNGWENECNDWKRSYAKANSELFQKGLAYGMLEETYKKEKANGEVLLKDRDALKKRVEKLEEERDYWKRRCNSVVTDISNTLSANGIELKVKDILGDVNWKLEFDIPELNEAKDKIIELEQKVRDERRWCDYWRHTYYAAEKVASVVGVSIKIDGIESQHNSAKVIVQNDKAEELKKQVVQMEDLEKKLKAAKSNGTYWRDRKEEEEDYHYYWVHTYDRVVKQAAEKGVYINVTGTDDDCNAGIVIVTNNKAQDLEKQVVQMEDANQKLRQRISAADEEIDKVDNYWQRRYDDLAECWTNTHKDIVAVGKKVGVKIDIQGKKSDSNTCPVYITNEKALGLAYDLNRTRQMHDKKWSAMTEALKDKGVEVIYMGEEDGKPIIDIKVPEWDSDKQWVRTFATQVADFRADKFRLERERDELKEQCDILRKDGVLKGQQCLKLKADLNDLKKEHGRVLGEFALCRKQAECDHKKLEELKSRTLDNVEIRLSCGDIVWTYCDGFVHVSSGIISSDEIDTRHINCLCKNYFDAESISHGTVPKCSSCAHYMHNPSRFAHDWCYMPIPKEGGAGYIRKLNKEEAEGPACVDFKAKE